MQEQNQPNQAPMEEPVQKQIERAVEENLEGETTQEDPTLQQDPSNSMSGYTVPPVPVFVKAEHFYFIEHDLGELDFRDKEWCVGSVFLTEKDNIGLAVVIAKEEVVKLGALSGDTPEGKALRKEQSEQMKVIALTAASEFSGQLVVPVNFAYSLLSDLLRESLGQTEEDSEAGVMNAPPLSEN